MTVYSGTISGFTNRTRNSSGLFKYFKIKLINCFVLVLLIGLIALELFFANQYVSTKFRINNLQKEYSGHEAGLAISGGNEAMTVEINDLIHYSDRNRLIISENPIIIFRDSGVALSIQ